MIIINKNFKIKKDSHSWVLIFNEIRQRKNKTTGEQEDFVFEDKWYYPDIKQCLTKISNETLKECETTEDLILKMDELISVINSLKNTIFK